jgi:glycosyltransferase 2 family protein
VTTLRRPIRLSLVLVKIAVTVGAVWFLLSDASLPRIATLMRDAELPLLGLAAVATVLQILAGAWRWQLVHQLLHGARPDYFPMLRGMSRSILFGQPLPSSVGSDAIRVVTLARDSSVTEALRTVICDRLLGLLSLMVVVVITLPAFEVLVGDGAAFISLEVASITGLIAMGAMVLLSPVLGRLPVVGTAPADLCRAVYSRAGIVPTTLAFVSHGLSVVMFAAIARSIAGDAPVLLIVLVILPAMLVASVPISLSGWGVREAVIATAYGIAGGAPAQGISASIIFGLSSPLVCALFELVTAVAWRRSPQRDKAASGAA